MGRIPGPFERLHASGFNLDRSARREGARNASRWGVGKKVLGARRNPRAPEVDPEFEIEMIGALTSSQAIMSTRQRPDRGSGSCDRRLNIQCPLAPENSMIGGQVGVGGESNTQ